jgi:hypothetical protein
MEKDGGAVGRGESSQAMTRHDLIWLIGTLLGASAVMAAFTVGLHDGGASFLAFGLVSIVVLGLRDLVYSWHRRSSRQDAMRQVADRHGFSFRKTARCNVLGWPDAMRLTYETIKLQQAVEKSPFPSAGSLLSSSRNVMEGTIDEATVAIFDYECDSSRRGDMLVDQTVFAASSADLPSPQFSLAAASAWDRLIDQFRVSSAIQDRRRLISDGAVQFRDLDSRLFTALDRRMTLEVGGGCMLLYQRGRIVEPDDFDGFLATGLQIHRLLSGMNLLAA